MQYPRSSTKRCRDSFVGTVALVGLSDALRTLSMTNASTDIIDVSRVTQNAIMVLSKPYGDKARNLGGGGYAFQVGKMGICKEQSVCLTMLKNSTDRCSASV